MHIHKIAFPPIDSPVILTEGEWLKSLKRYPFEVQSLPSASFNLIQQVGRLIRSNECHGEIVIYDRRLLTKSYGSRLLAALPVFPIEQREVPEADKAHQAALKSAAEAEKRARSARARSPANVPVNHSIGGRRRFTGVVLTMEVLLCARSASRSRIWSSCSIE